MKKYAIINDTHAGLTRQAGATPRSMAEFSAQQSFLFHGAIQQCEAQDIIFLGDIFDKELVPYEAVVAVAEALRSSGGRKYLVRGNHDQGGNQEKLTAFDLLGYMTASDNVVVVKEPTELEPGCWIVPHLPNQMQFDAAIAALPDGSTLLTHANYNNGFAMEKDHSLNLSREQAARFNHVILGHEHSKRVLPGLDILGALYPCNIGECAVAKGFHYWNGPGHGVEFQQLWSPSEGYAELDWKNLLGSQTLARFVRVTGSASAEEAAMVIDEVAKFRASSDAYFVSNSVTIGTLELGELESSSNDLAGFDVLAALKEMLPTKYHDRMEALQS